MEIRLKQLKKTFHSEGKTIKALDNIDLVIPANEIFTLLGPSGCGKTTLLRCIVGLETPDSGEIIIGGETVWSREKGIYVPPEKRGLGMVFQTYAIWPHMNVFENVAFPLKTRKVPADVIRKKVANVLEFVQMEGFENRPATKLSGGQQQRVALARALVAEPKVILFDEPLSNLDAKLREETRKELRRFLTTLKITAVYVTHDRIEALTLSDTVAVMKSGMVVEIGTPRGIYFDASHRFVADFIGRANLIDGRVSETADDYILVDSEIGPLKCRSKKGLGRGDGVTVCVRPEFIRVAEKFPDNGTNLFTGRISSMLFVGDSYEADVSIGSTVLTTRVDPGADVAEGGRAAVFLDPDNCFLVVK